MPKENQLIHEANMTQVEKNLSRITKNLPTNKVCIVSKKKTKCFSVKKKDIFKMLNIKKIA